MPIPKETQLCAKAIINSIKTMFERLTFSMIKPDATKRRITGKIIADIEDAGFEIIGQKMLILSKETAEDFYNIHREKPFFQSMIAEMTCGPVVAQVLKKEDAVSEYRKLMGATNPDEALDGTLRKKYGLVIDRNSVHGSDSMDNAKREIEFFFKKDELVL